MRARIASLILSVAFYLSLVRGTNIALFYPSDETMLATIDFTLQTLTNFTLLLLVILYFFVINKYDYLTGALGRASVALILIGAVGTLVFSVDLVQSLKFMGAVAAITLPSLIYANVYGAEKLFAAFARFIVVTSFLHIAYIVAMPQYGIMSGEHSGKWRGLMEHKNSFGPFYAISFYILLHTFPKRGVFPVLAWIVTLILSLVFIVKAQSSTGLVMFALMGAFYAAMMFVYRFRSAWERIALMLIVTSSLAILYFLVGDYIAQMLFELTGKDATFTGRTAIWKILLDMIAQRPMTGYGPGMSERPEFMEQIQGRLSWDAKGSHNSYLDLLVNYGYPETILLLFIVLKIFFASFAAPYFSRAAIRTTVLSASIVFVVLVMSFTNASALFSRSIFSVLLIASTAVLAGYQQKVNIEARGTRKIREEYAPAS